MTHIRKIFTVFINNKYYDVYSIEGKEHAGENGAPKNWWLYYSEQLPEGLTPPIDSPHLIAWNDTIDRLVFTFNITQGVSSKVKWDELRFSNHTHVEMFCNGKLFYSFGTTGGERGYTYAMAKIQYLIIKMGEHPFNFFNPETEDGRKIYWHGLPATIKLSSSRPWEIRVHPDLTCGLTANEWWKELRNRESLIPAKEDDMTSIEKEYDNDDERNQYINWGSALSDKYINWFRS